MLSDMHPVNVGGNNNTLKIITIFGSDRSSWSAFPVYLSSYLRLAISSELFKRALGDRRSL